jgi:hypothetical protein
MTRKKTISTFNYQARWTRKTPKREIITEPITPPVVTTTEIWAATWIATDPAVPNSTLAAESLGNVNYYSLVKPMIQVLDCIGDGNYTLSTATAFVTGATGCPQRFTNIVNKLKELPAGKRSLGMYRYNNGPIYDEPGDEGAEGLSSPYAENAITRLRTDWLTIANALNTNGAIPDYIIFDSEKGGLFGIFGRAGGDENEVNNIILDPVSFETWYTTPSFSNLYTSFGTLPFANYNNIKNNVFHPQLNPEYLYWNKAVQALFVELLDQSFYLPTLQIFPNIKMSNYENKALNDSDYYYDSNGHTVKSYRLMGDGNAPVLYGSWTSPSVYGIMASDTTRLVRTNFTTTLEFAVTAWNQFLILINNMRAVRRASTAPIRPWIASIDFTGDAAFNPKWKTDTTVDPTLAEGLYWESIRHACLTGAEMFNYWNTSDNTTQKLNANCSKLNTVLEDVNTRLGGYSNTVANLNNVNFTATNMISGAKIFGTENYLWRVTVRPGYQLLDSVSNPIEVDSDGGAWIVTSNSTIPTISSTIAI